MKKLLLIILATISLYAEATFEQVQKMIDKQEYGQAKLALTIITQNHPNSAKAFYSLAQANAGLGDLPSARAALNQAQALNPTLNFVPLSQVEKLRQAIQPQTALIAKVEEPSHWFRNLILIIILGVLGFFGYKRFKQSQKADYETTKQKTKEEVKSTSHTYTAKVDDIEEFRSGKNSTNTSYSKVDTSPSYHSAPKHTTSYVDRHTEVHHHHHHNESNGLGTVGAIAAAGVTAAAVSHLMNEHTTPVEIASHNPYANLDVSDTWDEPEPISNSWEDSESTRNNSWEDDSSSNSSWSDSSSDSNSSWND